MTTLEKIAFFFALTFLFHYSAQANDNDELEKLRDEIQQIKQNYEVRIKALESRLEYTVPITGQTEKKVDEVAQQSYIRPSASNTLNPDISLVLSGTYANRSQDSNYHISGFQAAGKIGPGSRGINLGESELGIYANIDPDFYGGLNLSLSPDNSANVEEAFVQTTTLPYGLTLKAGRFFSSIGYLNDQHSHTWDFVDNPLVYEAFLGNQLGDDAIQLKWLAPSDLFMELGAEFGRGRIADTAGRDKNGVGLSSIFGHIGGDVGISNSWRSGLSYLQVSPNDQISNDLDATGHYVTNSFTGKSKLFLADFVWKWAPNGNASNTSLKLQGEYIHQNQDGLLNADNYSASQSGWYLQAIYHFMPYWRSGLRLDRLDSGTQNYGLNSKNLNVTEYEPQRFSWMIDYNPSEFSRIRLQLSHDESRQLVSDNQLFIQYQMSLGAHGAHKY